MSNSSGGSIGRPRSGTSCAMKLFSLHDVAFFGCFGFDFLLLVKSLMACNLLSRDLLVFESLLLARRACDSLLSRLFTFSHSVAMVDFWVSNSSTRAWIRTKLDFIESLVSGCSCGAIEKLIKAY